MSGVAVNISTDVDSQKLFKVDQDFLDWKQNLLQL